jgi:hypothetical protein
MSKVVRLPDTLADFLKKYPLTIGELVTQIEAGLLSLNIDVTALQPVTNNQAYDFESMINEAIAPLLARLEALEANRTEATAPAKKPLMLSQNQKVIAMQKLQDTA